MNMFSLSRNLPQGNAPGDAREFNNDLTVFAYVKCKQRKHWKPCGRDGRRFPYLGITLQPSLRALSGGNATKTLSTQVKIIPAKSRKTPRKSRLFLEFDELPFSPTISLFSSFNLQLDL